MKSTWLTINELARALKVSVKTVRRAYLAGEIPVERIFRFVRFDVEQVKEAMRRNGEGHDQVGNLPSGERRARSQRPRSVKRGRNFQGSTRRNS